MNGADPDRLRQEAALAEQAGNALEAKRLIAQAVAAAPQRADLHNSAGTFALRSGDLVAAIGAFRKAATISPQSVDFTVNLAIALGQANEVREALDALGQCERQGASDKRYCSARASLERKGGDLAAAQRWYAACLAIDPHHAKAQQGSARVALERGDPRALALYDAALGATPGDPELWLGKAQVLETLGDRQGARDIAAALVGQFPGWLDAIRLMAQLRLGDGEADFTADYRAIAERHPDQPTILLDWCATLAGLDLDAEAADVAALGRQRFGEHSAFPLLEAVHRSAAGDDTAAEAIFASLQTNSVERIFQEARHRLRRGQPDAAEALLASVIEAQPKNISAWALRDVAWRLLGDPRHDWLHGQPGLVAFLPLELSDSAREAGRALLDRIHDDSTMPLGQSVRGGSQTRGGLFDRLEPELAQLKQGIERTLENYRAGLAAADPAHPLLRHRDQPWSIVGSWSVRLSSGSGAHVSHIHPQGIVSSALYLTVPAEVADNADQAGWLEIGRPAADLRTTLPPLRVVQPVEGYLALFPSTLYHGTRPFAEGRRMTVAFDVGRGFNNGRARHE